MGRFVPVLTTCITTEKQSQFKMTAACMGGSIAQSQAYGTCLRYGAKACYDGRQCWQYKIVMDKPGAYCWTAPSNAVCARTVLIGGGGKPKCISVPDAGGSTCASAGGAGGAYSEKIHAVTGGVTYFCVIVGRQEQDTTMSCNGSAVHTAGGASGCIAGVASGGDWNSCGGAAGYTCNDCGGGSFSHYCGSCKYICCTTCCGYCILYQYTDASNDAVCCSGLFAGGASAGSWQALCGGAARCICGSGGGAGYGAVAGGGAGIGDWAYQNLAWHYNCCNCICTFICDDRYQGHSWCVNCPPSAQGGGGTRIGQAQCRSWASQNCTRGVWKGGDGGPGGLDQQESNAWVFEWGYQASCSYPFGSVWCQGTFQFRCAMSGPVRHDWWDIHDMCGSGSPGTVGGGRVNCSDCRGYFYGVRPRNSGEGAGTGGITNVCCNPMMHGNMYGATAAHFGGTGPLINWPKICQLGCCGWCDQAWLMRDALFPYFLTCAGTLGGSGGVSLCGYSSKAGHGGGGGQAKCQVLCVCWGGAYDCCSGTLNTPLAFPPCLLDQLMSNAGTGMAIIYYREA